MYLVNLTLNNFRNYEYAQLDLSPHINLIKGLNAQGKTNLLEAVYLLCLGRSFRAAKNQELVRSDKSFFTIKGLVRQDNQIDKAVLINYVRDGRKEITVDRKRLASHSKVFGQFPVVIMAPDEFKVTAGSPADRRRFLDILLSQVSLSYLSDLQEYNRILKQRNKILQSFKEGQSIAEATLTPWTENLVKTGSRIIEFRNSFVTTFAKTLQPLYKKYTDTEDELNMVVDSTVFLNSERNCSQAFEQAVEKKSTRERMQGTSLVGPHRDDLVFTINGMDLRRFGSRGEHKSVLITLKIAEFMYLQQKNGEKPVLLLDDCYSELDNSRKQGVFRAVQGLGQVLMTSPVNDFESKQFDFNKDEHSEFLVEVGCIELVHA